MSFIYVNVVIPNNEDAQAKTALQTHSTPNDDGITTITPTDEAGKGIRTLKDDNTGYLASIRDKNGQVYYFNNRSTVVAYYDKVNGDYSSQFKVECRNATINGHNNSKLIIRIL